MTEKQHGGAAGAHRPMDSRRLSELRARVLRRGTQALYEDAALFDQLYRRRRQDVRFYVQIARRYGGPVLELGCGSGRVAFELAQAGIEVLGIDTMPSMLQRARERSARLPQAARARVSFRRGDMRRLKLGRTFRLVIAPFNAFTHLYTRRDLERALAGCRDHLAARGRLVFDVPMPDLRALAQDPERLYACGSLLDARDGQRYRQYEASHYDPVEQIRSVTFVFERADRPREQRALPLTQRQFFPAELEALLFYNGFAIERRYGDFAGGALEPHSESQVVVARPSTGRSARAAARPGYAGRARA